MAKKTYRFGTEGNRDSGRRDVGQFRTENSRFHRSTATAMPSTASKRAEGRAGVIRSEIASRRSRDSKMPGNDESSQR